jgi:hypothetical protein
MLFDEHFRKWDKWRFANLKKLKAVEKRLLYLPSIYDMFNAECATLKPATATLRCKRIDFKPRMFEESNCTPDLDAHTKASGKVVSERLEERLDLMVGVWNSFKQYSEFETAKSEDMPTILKTKREQVRDDINDMRGFYNNHRHVKGPLGELLDERWAHFRWIQVQLLAGLDFFASYGLGATLRREDMIHELLDLDYLVPALLIGGLASCEKRMIERFRLLRPDGIVLKKT